MFSADQASIKELTLVNSGGGKSSDIVSGNVLVQNKVRINNTKLFFVYACKSVVSV